MKTKKLGKKLSLSKATIANLEHNELKSVKGGYYATKLWGGCTTWHPICFTEPAYRCQPEFSVFRPCYETVEIC
jgi:natural product precursor